MAESNGGFWDTVWEQVDRGGELIDRHGGNLIDLYADWRQTRQPADVDAGARTDWNQPQTQSGPQPTRAGLGLGLQGGLWPMIAIGLAVVVIADLGD